MGTHFILVGLLCGVSLSQECRRGLLANVNFPGSDITSLYSPDAEHCQYLCTQHPSCLFFSFLRPDWAADKRQFFCYLKSTPSKQPNVQHSEVGITSGFSLKPCYPDQRRHITKSCAPPAEPCLPRVYQNVDFFGADYRALFTADHEECQRACTNDPACQFFTFLKSDYPTAKYRYKCHLKFSWNIPRIPKITRSASRVSGFSERIQETQNFATGHETLKACEGNLSPHTNIPGFDIEVLPAVSPEHCQTFCSARPLCTYFSYNSQNFKCYLKRNPDQMARSAAAGITSGLPTRFCQPNNNWIKKTYVGIDFPYSDIRNFMTDGVESCQRTCTEDPSCQFFSIVAKRRCYLKRVITMPAPPKINKWAHLVSGFSLRNCLYRPT
ncbi:coagulation factor XI-like [Pagrus major]|uniref:coagulation factor XI-like n=1 Tax=Pagrus major TaxID=143350 RepID=UPI003CC84488